MNEYISGLENYINETREDFDYRNRCNCCKKFNTRILKNNNTEHLQCLNENCNAVILPL